MSSRIGLDDVVVGPEVEEPHDLVLVVAGGGDDHGNLRDGPDHRQGVGAVQVGEPEVEDHDVDAARHRHRHTGHALPLGNDVVASLGEGRGDGLTDANVVLDDQDRCHEGTIPTPPRFLAHHTES